MARWKRLFYYLLINILVSACTTLAVLTIWERTHPQTAGSVSTLVQNSPVPVTPVSATLEAGPTRFTRSTEPAEPSEPADPVLTSTQAFITYRVQAGDTLGKIALEFGVPVDEIVRLNELEDADSLSVGTELTIPVIEPTPDAPPIATETPEDTAEPTQEGPTGTPSPSAGDPQVVVTNIFGAGVLSTERVRLERRGEGDLDLEGWQLVDEDDRIYIFPQLTLFPGGGVNLFTRAGNNDTDALYWGLEEPVWETGEIATLLDDRGNIRATFTVP